MTAKSPSRTPSTSPRGTTPAIVTASRVATVTAPWRRAPAAAVMCTTSSSNRRSRVVHGERREPLDAGAGWGSRRPAGPRRGPAPAAASATARLSASLGSTITSRARARRRPSSSSPSRPGDRVRRAPRSRRQPRTARRARHRPPPTTTPRPVGREVAADPARAGVVERWVTRMRCGRPAAIPASIAAPTSSTCTCTFHVGSPPTTTSESPSGRERLAQRRDLVRGGVEQEHHLVRRPAAVLRGTVGGARRRVRLGRLAVAAGVGRACGAEPVTTSSRASRRTQSPRPPASTTPAGASTSSWSGVRSSASRAASAAAVTQRAAGRGGPSSASAAAAAAAQHLSMVPSTGSADGRVGRVGRLRRARRRATPRRARARRRAQPVAEPAQHLAQDHPGVAPRAHQRAARDGREDLGAVRVRRRSATASAAASTVRWRLVPVSPSGTG